MQFRWRHWLVKVVGSCVLAVLSATAGASGLAGYGPGDGTSRSAAAQGKGRALHIQNGIFTVDGLTVRTGVDLQLAGVRFLYLYVPGSGTALVSERPFRGAEEQRSAFRGNTLTILAGGSRLQLTAARRMRGTRSAYVRFDPGAGPRTRMPAVSYGQVDSVPAVWPEADPLLPPIHRRLKVKGRRALRSARLCRPSPTGHEACAVIHEVVYQH